MGEMHRGAEEAETWRRDKSNRGMMMTTKEGAVPCRFVLYQMRLGVLMRAKVSSTALESTSSVGESYSIESGNAKFLVSRSGEPITRSVTWILQQRRIRKENYASRPLWYT